MKYNLAYKSVKTGMKIMGRRVPGSRKIELSTGEIETSTWASRNLEYLGKFEESGNFHAYTKPKIERMITPNGFKIVTQKAL